MSKITNIAAILNKSRILSRLLRTFSWEIMKRTSSIIPWKKDIYLSTTYVKFILLAYSVFLKNKGKRTCLNSDCLMAHEAYRDNVIAISRSRISTLKLCTTVLLVPSSYINPYVFYSCYVLIYSFRVCGRKQAVLGVLSGIMGCLGA